MSMRLLRSLMGGGVCPSFCLKSSNPLTAGAVKSFHQL